MRAFGSHGPSNAPVPNGLQPTLRHDEVEEHHHHAVKTAAPDQTFIVAGGDSKRLAFDGLRGTTNAVISLDN